MGSKRCRELCILLKPTYTKTYTLKELLREPDNNY